LAPHGRYRRVAETTVWPHQLEHGGCANIDATKKWILRKDSTMGDKSPKNTSKTKKQKAQKKAASASKPAPKK
jgi:hypothetical protein